MPSRTLLIAVLAAVLLAAAGATAVTAELSRPALDGWAETVGFVAGLAVGAGGVGVLLRLTSRNPGA